MKITFLLYYYIYMFQNLFKQTYFSGTTLVRSVLRSQTQMGPSISEGQVLALQCISPTSEPRAEIL